MSGKIVKTENSNDALSPLSIILPTIYTTKKIDEDGEIYEGSGTSRREADQNASESVRSEESSGNVSDRSGCFISTACIQARGLPDNCLELQVLRGFRDNYVKNLVGGDRIVKEYYSIAPKIVSIIGKTRDSAIVYSGLFRNLVQNSVSMIMKGKHAEAFENYMKVVRELKGKYL